MRRAGLPPREERPRLLFRDDQKLVIVVEHCTAPRPREQTGLRGSQEKYVSAFNALAQHASETCCPDQQGQFNGLENPPLKEWPLLDKGVFKHWARAHIDSALNRSLAMMPQRKSTLMNGYSMNMSRVELAKPKVEEPGPWMGPRIGSFEVVFSLTADGGTKVTRPNEAARGRALAAHVG